MWIIETHGTMDFETYSEAGFVWVEDGQKWIAPRGATKKGISAVGTLAYAEHPTTEVLTLSYRLPGYPIFRWQPGLPNPQLLFDYVASGGLIEAHNAMFERAIWYYVCMRLYGWPALPPRQLRCSMAKARVNSRPGALGDLTSLLPVTTVKDADGKRLLDKFSIPRTPTKKDPRTRIRPQDDPEDAERLYRYCDTDIIAENEVSNLLMPMTQDELRFWLLDQEINWRGVGIDMDAVQNMVSILDQAIERYGEEFALITGGLKPSQVQATVGWLAAKGVYVASLDAEAITEALGRTLAPDVRRVLEIRQLVGSASVKKLFAIERTANRDNRVRNIIIHHGARTGRPTGDLLQPLNLPKAGPDLLWCQECGAPSKWPPVRPCPWCFVPLSPVTKKRKWSHEAVDWVQRVMATRDLATVEHFFGDALLSISGSIRGAIVAGPGNELIASDYSAIEAVVTAMLAGEQWRIDAFREGRDIYLMSCAQMDIGFTYEQYLDYKRENGDHHWHRQKKGKVAELALGFGGWVSAWLKFAPGDSEDEIKTTILDWRKASPSIVEMWGGQERGRPWEASYRLERFGFEGAFINAIQYPDHVFTSNGIQFFMRGDALIVKLLSTRELTYHCPRLHESTRSHVGAGVLEITYETWNSNATYGPPGWSAQKTYSGKICENIVQATAHDIQRYGIEALEAAGYPIVLHVYDENVAEVPIGYGSIEEFEAIMGCLPPWAADWPIRASGGWRGRRYRKG